MGKDALLRIARSEANTFIDSLKNVEEFITHLNKVLEERHRVLTQVVEKYAGDRQAHHPRQNYYEALVEALHSNQTDDTTTHKYPLSIVLPAIYHSHFNEHYSL